MTGRIRLVFLTPSSNTNIEPLLLLTNANVDIIGWMGTSPGWSGIEADEALYQFITAATGIPATTAVLSLRTKL
ncbi:Asp/Glu/hydantoin racemase [Penicillium expansum]|nr:Asp/Glu/hydantoin racemase [Penicillium expansum]